MRRTHKTLVLVAFILLLAGSTAALAGPRSGRGAGSSPVATPQIRAAADLDQVAVERTRAAFARSIREQVLLALYLTGRFGPLPVAPSDRTRPFVIDHTDPIVGADGDDERPPGDSDRTGEASEDGERESDETWIDFGERDGGSGDSE